MNSTEEFVRDLLFPRMELDVKEGQMRIIDKYNSF